MNEKKLIPISDIGKEIYDMLPTHDKAIVSYGMIPLHVMEAVENSLRTRIATLQCETFKFSEADTKKWLEVFKGKVDKDYVNTFLQEVHVAILKRAKSLGKLNC